MKVPILGVHTLCPSLQLLCSCCLLLLTSYNAYFYFKMGISLSLRRTSVFFRSFLDIPEVFQSTTLRLRRPSLILLVDDQIWGSRGGNAAHFQWLHFRIRTEGIPRVQSDGGTGLTSSAQCGAWRVERLDGVVRICRGLCLVLCWVCW